MLVDNVPIMYLTTDVGHSSGQGVLLLSPGVEELRDFISQTVERANPYLTFFTGPLSHESYATKTAKERSCKVDTVGAQLGGEPGY